MQKSFQGRQVVRGINLQINAGEAIGLLGPNGAGKTTCFAMITGLMIPDQGQIFLNDKNITRTPMFKRARLGISYLPQDASIFRGLNVSDNLIAAIEMVTKDDDVQQETLESLLEDFGLTHLRETPTVALSGGERRRVEIARALAIKPKFICLDEPLAGIDPIAVGDIKEIIMRLKSHNIGILITDHNVRETLGIVDRAYIVAEGKILTEGTPSEILIHREVRRVYLGERFSM